MPFDAIFLSAVVEEITPRLLGARVEKIQQPARDLVLLTLRGKEKLLLSANTSRPRVHLTGAGFENPSQPPMFCMLLRKHLSGGRIVSLTQPLGERCLDLCFDCTDEMGVPCQKHLILELMGRNSNLILTDPEGRIIDCLRRVDFEMSELRQVLPGLFYHQPPSQNKRIPWQTDVQTLKKLLLEIQGPKRLDQWLLDTFGGLSPLIAREIAFTVTGETDGDIFSADREELAQRLKDCLAFSEEKLPVLLRLEGKPKDFSFRPIGQYGTYMTQSTFPSFSELLDEFYTQSDHDERMRQKTQTLRKLLSNLLDRTVRKSELQRKELAETLDRERLRQLGDIVTANLHTIQRGQLVLEAVDFYDADMQTVRIPLKPNLSPQQNAAKFYKDYTKAKHRQTVLTQQIQQGRQEAEYLGAVLESLSRVENERDLSEIRAELEEGGYVRPTEKKKNTRQKTQAPGKPLEFYSTRGERILVGRNNRQNDQLTFKIAHKKDIWLHVQKFHGAHVVISCGGEEVSDETITQAAMLAAYYSEAKESQNVPVDVTAVGNLKKPKGAKPGMVIYERYRTVLVTPEGGLPEKLREGKIE